MSSLTITVSGVAKPKGSMRHVGHGRMIESLKDSPAWRTAVKDAAIVATAKIDGYAFDNAVHVAICCYFARPANHYRTGKNAHLLRDGAPEYPATRSCGDADKLARNVLDALVDAGVFKDDSQVVSLRIDKHYCPPEFTPRTVIGIAPVLDRFRGVA